MFFLTFKAFDLEHHVSGDVSFIIEHGIGEGLFGDGADFSGDTVAELMNGFDGPFIEDGFLSACQFEVMGDVLLALIKTEGLDEGSRVRLSREAQSMGMLGSHSHIMTVFDLGEEAGQPFLVQEFMAKNSRHAIATWRTVLNYSQNQVSVNC